MGKFFGKIGYVDFGGDTPGVWEESITEKKYTGDVLKNTRRWQSGSTLNDDLNVNNLISIISDPFADKNFMKIRYVIWMGAKWKVTNVEVLRPRLILTLGGVYNENTT